MIAVGFLSVFVALSIRGVLEMSLGKPIAYVVQAVGIVIGISLLAVGTRLKERETESLESPFRGLMRIANGAIVVVLSIAASVIATEIAGREVVVEYSMVVVYPFLLYIVLSAVRVVHVSEGGWFSTLVAVLWGLGLVAVFQQLGIEEELPGRTEHLDLITRPPSLTGSYLHYPLIMAVGCMALVQAILNKSTGLRLVLVVPLAFFVATSLGRSGYFIVILAAVMGSLNFVLMRGTQFFRGFEVEGWWRWPSGVGGLVVVLVAMDWVFAEGVFSMRLMSALDTESLGNDGRLEVWHAGFRLWAEGPMVVGSYFGHITNVGRNIGGVDSVVVESSVLQQLLNIGLIGTIAYYWLFWRLWRDMRSTSAFWIRAVFLASVVQTLFYQSIEVLPFVTLVMLLPLMSGTARDRGRSRVADDVLCSTPR